MSAADRMHAQLIGGGMSTGLLSDDINGSYDLEADNASSVSGFVGGLHQSPTDHLDYPAPMNRQPHRFSVRIGSTAASRDQRGVGAANNAATARRGLGIGMVQQVGSTLPQPQQRSLAASCGGSNNNSASQLHEAAASGDLGRVRHLVFEAGVTPDFSDDSGRTPLHCAAMAGQQGVVALLLQTGCNVDGEDCDGSPPLYYAARYGHVEAVRLLLAHGCPATVDKQNFDTGNTAVHEAAARGFSQTLKLLIHAKANIAIVNKELNTPLHLAAQYGHNQCSRILLYAGAVVESRNNHGDTVLHVAARFGGAGVVRVLLAGVLGGGSGAVSGAMSSRGGAGGNVNYMVLLSSTNRTGDTPLHLASAHRHRNVVRLLLDAGADPSIRNRAGDTPAQLASRKGFSDIATMVASFMRMGGSQAPAHLQQQQQQQQAWLMQQPPSSPAPGGYPNDFGAWPQNQAANQQQQQQSAPFFNLVPSTRPGVKQDSNVARGSASLADPYNTGSLRYCHQHQSGGRSTDGLFYYPNDGRMPPQQQGRQVPMGYPGTVAPISYAARPMMSVQQQQQVGYPMQSHQMLFQADSQAGIHVLGGYDGGMMAADGNQLGPLQPINNKKSGKESASGGKQVAFATTKPSNGKSGKSMFSWVERRFDALVTKLSHFKGSSKSKAAAAPPPVPPNAAEEILQQQSNIPQPHLLMGPTMDDQGRVTMQRGAYRPVDADNLASRPPLPTHPFLQQQQQMAFRQSQAMPGAYRNAQVPFMQQQQLHNLPQFDQPQPLFSQPPQQPMYRQQEQHLYQQRNQQQAPRLYRTRSDDTLSVSDYKCQTWKKYHRALRAVDDTAFATDAAVRLHQQQIMRMCPAPPRPTSASNSSISSGGSVMSGPIAADRAEQLLVAKRTHRGAIMPPSSQQAATISGSSHSGSVVGSQGHPPAAFHPTSAASDCSHSGIAPLNSGSSSQQASKPNSERATSQSSPNEMDATTKPQGGIAMVSDAEDIDTASMMDNQQPCTTESFKKSDGTSPSLVNASTPAKIVLSFLKGIANNAQVRRPIADIQPSSAQQQSQVSSSAGAALATAGDSESAENEMVFQSADKYAASKPPSGSVSYSGYSAMHMRCSVTSSVVPPAKMTGSTTSSNGGMCVSAMSIGAHDSQSPSGASNQSSGYESVKIAAQFLMAAPSRPTATSTPEKNILSSARGMAIPPHQRPELSPIETPRRCSSPIATESPVKTPTTKPVAFAAVLKKSPSKSENNVGVLTFSNPLPVPPSLSSPTSWEKSKSVDDSIEEQENRDIETYKALPILPRPVPAPVPSSTVLGRYGSSLTTSSNNFSENQFRALSYHRLAGSVPVTASSVQSSPVRSLLQTATSTNPYATVRAPVLITASRQLASVFDTPNESNPTDSSCKSVAHTVTSQV